MAHWTEEAFVENPGLLRPDLEARAADADGEVEALLALLADEHGVEPATALDVPCGIGRHVVPLVERGIDVTGVDLSPAYIERARERVRDAGVDAPVLEGDMRDLLVDDSFDLVVNLWTSFGYYDEATDRAILAALRDRVADDGALVMELSNKDGVLANFDDDGVTRGDDHLAVETREFDPERSRMHTEREVFEAAGDGYEHVGTMTFETRMFDPDTLRRWLLDAGFGTVTPYADLEGNDPTRESTRMAVVAER